MVGDVTSKGVGIESLLVDDVVLRGDKNRKRLQESDAKNMFSDRLESFSYPFWA